ncbi:putative PEP-CTERM system TPR-repeat lipoprotein [Thiocystis violascens DSM 198]|uniref:Putative PEP-CTERM system TPR-repeat lipoprotein n=1 Tax=Thiocystis violascens (strain ATCC 17096 / DSM 198 / 6111) TaxID=765911 RepID=I3YGF9_THIV6|nr:putative PEP-CTERM system TPR-repeat lipoprotein [Thiocystis violascens DSM 198]
MIRVPSRRYGLIAVVLTVLTGTCGAAAPENDLARGEAALKQGELKTAVIELKNALQADAQNPRARALLGQAYLRMGDQAAATRELERAQKLGAESTDVQPWLALAWLRQGNIQRLQELAIPDTATSGLRAELLAIQAESLLGQGDPAGAEAKASEALKADGESAPARLAMARIQASNRKLDEARTLVNQVLEHDLTNATALNLLGEIERAAGDPATAEAAFTKAMADPVIGVQSQLSRAYVRIQANRLDEAQADIEQLRKRLKNNPQIDYAEGLLLYTRKDYAKAIDRLTVALGANPDFAAAQALAGAARMARGEPELAKIHLERAVSARPDDLATRRMLAMALLQLGEAQETERLARAILQEAPGDVATMDLLASALMTQGKREESVTYLRQVKAVLPDSAAASARLGAALLGQGDSQEGLAALQEALKMDPTFQGAAEQLVLGAVRGGELDRALEAALDYRKREPGSARAQTLLGVVYLQRKETAAASEAFRKALDLDPTDLAASSALAAMALQDKDLEKAKGYFTASLKHHPENAQVLIMLAKLALAQNDQAGAKSYLDDAVARNPKALEPRLYLAAYHLQRGEPAQSLEIVSGMQADFPKNTALLGVMVDAQIALKQYGAAKSTLQELSGLVPDDPKIRVARALADAGLGDSEQAKRELEQALVLDETFVPAINLLARLAIAEKDLAGAERRLQELKNRLGSTHPDVYLIEGQVAQLKGDSSAANEAFQDLLTAEGAGADFDTDSKLWGAAEQLVLGYLRNDDQSGALQAALDLRKRQPESVRAHTLLGILYLRDQKTDDAAQSFRKALELEPGNVAASSGLASIAIQAKDYVGAKTYYEESLKRNPSNVGILASLARLALIQEDQAAAQRYLDEAVKLNPRQLQPRLYLGAYHLKQDNPEEAIRVLSEVRSDFPQDVSLLGLLAESELAFKRFEEARKTLEQLARLTPNDPKVSIAIARAEVGLDHPDKAEQALEQALQIDPKSIAALSGLTRLAIAKKSVPDAKSRIVELKKIVGAEHPDALLLEGNLAESQGEWGAALSSYQALFDQTPSTANLVWLARARMQSGDTDGAERLMAKWVEQHPEDGLIQFQLAQLYMNLKRTDDAIVHFERALGSNPKNVIAMNNLAWLIQDRDPSKALDYARQAYAAAPKSADIADTLAMVLLRNGDAREARRVIDKALEIDADNGSILFHKAQILREGDDTREATQVLESALKGDRQFPERSEAEALLKSLRGR